MRRRADGRWPMARVLAILAILAGQESAVAQVGDAEPAGPPVAAAPASSAKVDEAVRLQRNIKRRYTELIRIMHDVAKQIATADPDTASAIESAAAKAEEALIADDMERVVSLLQSGLIVPADATQANIIKRLQEVLKALQGGDELEWLLFVMEQMREEKAALEAIVRAQRELERLSRILANPAASREKLTSARSDLAPLAARQADLAKRLRELPTDPVSARLGSTRQVVADMERRFEKVRPAFASQYPSADEMTMMGVQAQDLMRHAIRRRTELRTLFNDPDIGGPLEKLGMTAEREQVDTAISRTIEELEKSAKACGQDNLDEARVAFAEAERSLQDVAGSMRKIMGAMPGTKPLMGILNEQSLLSAEIEKFAPALERLVPVEKDVRAPGDRPGGDGTDTGANAAAGDETRFDPAGVAFLQDRNAGIVAGWLERLDVAGREIDERLADPQYPQQKDRQDRVTEAIRVIVMRNRERAKDDARFGTNETASAASTNAPADFKPFAFPNEMVNDIAKAMGFTTTAAGHLAASAPAPANASQNDALKILERVLADLATTVDMRLSLLELELVEHWIAYFYRMIMQQKACSAETLTVWGKRLPDKTFRRPEQLRLVTLSKGEARILKDLDMVDKVLALPHGHAWKPPPKVFFLFKEMIREGVTTVKDRLAAYDAGPETQELQRQVLEWMEGALKGMMLQGAEEGDPEKPPQWGWDGISNKDATKRGRRVEVELMMLLQQQINVRVRKLATELREKPDSEELRAQLRRTIELQGNVLNMANEFMITDDSIDVIGGPMHMGK